MIIPKSLLAVCSADTTRYAMNFIYVDVEKKEAVATDGRMLAVVPIMPEPGEVSGYLPREAVLHADKQAKMLKGRLFHGETTTVVEGVTFPNPFPAGEQPRYPDYAQLWPVTTPLVLNLDAGMLRTIAHSLDAKEQISISFDPENPGIMVIDGFNGSGKGLLCGLARKGENR